MVELWAFFTGTWEWIIVVVVAILLFGRRLPQVGRSLGRGIVEFKKGVRELEDDIDDATEPKTSGDGSPPKDAKADAKASDAAPAPPTDKPAPSDESPKSPAG